MIALSFCTCSRRCGTCSLQLWFRFANTFTVEYCIISEKSGECRDSDIFCGAERTSHVIEPVGMANCVPTKAATLKFKEKELHFKNLMTAEAVV